MNIYTVGEPKRRESRIRLECATERDYLSIYIYLYMNISIHLFIYI